MSVSVSICIPAYQQPAMLRRTLDSIFAQTYQDYEVVITDDSADDGVERVARGYGDGRVRYYRNAERQGSPENWNEAVRHATGRYIKMMHHDDWFAGAGSLGRFVEMLEGDAGAVLAFSGAEHRDPDGAYAGRHGATAEQIEELRRRPAALFRGNFIGAPSAVMFRAGEPLVFDRRMKWLADVDLYIRLLAGGGGFVATTDPLVCIGVASPGRVTAECEGNAVVETFEAFLLYSKLKSNGWATFADLGQLVRTVSRLELNTEKAIIDCGVDAKLARRVHRWQFLARIRRRMGLAR